LNNSDFVNAVVVFRTAMGYPSSRSGAAPQSTDIPLTGRLILTNIDFTAFIIDLLKCMMNILTKKKKDFNSFYQIKLKTIILTYE
jgi:hypothetical protein